MTTCPCSGSTSGSTPTTSAIRTADPTTSKPGGTSSTGKRSRRGSTQLASRRAIRFERGRVPGGDVHPVPLPRSQATRMQRVEATSPTDGQLIERIATGDRSAFEELYGRYARAVLGLAIRRLGDRGRAEDATQDAFVAIWRSARTY